MGIEQGSRQHVQIKAYPILQQRSIHILEKEGTQPQFLQVPQDVAPTQPFLHDKFPVTHCDGSLDEPKAPSLHPSAAGVSCYSSMNDLTIPEKLHKHVQLALPPHTSLEQSLCRITSAESHHRERQFTLLTRSQHNLADLCLFLI